MNFEWWFQNVIQGPIRFLTNSYPPRARKRSWDFGHSGLGLVISVWDLYSRHHISLIPDEKHKLYAVLVNCNFLLSLLIVPVSSTGINSVSNVSRLDESDNKSLHNVIKHEIESVSLTADLNESVFARRITVVASVYIG